MRIKHTSNLIDRFVFCEKVSDVKACYYWEYPLINVLHGIVKPC